MTDHEQIVSIIIGEPTETDVILDATEEVEKAMQACWNWPKNQKLLGVTIKAMKKLYLAGVRAGEKRASNPWAAFYPAGSNDPFHQTEQGGIND